MRAFVKSVAEKNSDTCMLLLHLIKGSKEERGGGGETASQRLDYGNRAVDKMVERYDDLLECNNTVCTCIYTYIHRYL